jgi:hypothetical protein
MRLPTAALGIAAAVGCRSPAQPPDEGGVKSGEWRAREVAECGFSVEMPDFAARTDLTMPAFPDIIHVAYATRGGLAAECIAYPASMALPPPPEQLQQVLGRNVRHMEGLAGGIVDQQLTVEETGSAATYTVRFANGLVQRGRMMIVGHEVHELSAAIGKGRATEAELSRMIASYARAADR